jgi:hypothetical protein
MAIQNPANQVQFQSNQISSLGGGGRAADVSVTVGPQTIFIFF